MQFIQQGTVVQFQADAPSSPTDVSAQQVKRLIQTHAASEFFHITITQTRPTTQTDSMTQTPPETFPTHPIPEIASLLAKYDTLFQTPTHLPPPQTITHKIHLQPNASPVNVRPYRYPHFQKCEIEK